MSTQQLADNSRIKRGQQSTKSKLQFNDIPHDTLDGLLLTLPNGKVYIPIDIAQLEAKIFSTLVQNNLVQSTNHPLITQAINNAKTALSNFTVWSSCLLGGSRISLICNPEYCSSWYLRYASGKEYCYIPVTKNFVAELTSTNFRHLVVNFMLEKLALPPTILE